METRGRSKPGEMAIHALLRDHAPQWEWQCPIPCKRTELLLRPSDAPEDLWIRVRFRTSSHLRSYSNVKECPGQTGTVFLNWGRDEIYAATVDDKLPRSIYFNPRGRFAHLRIAAEEFNITLANWWCRLDRVNPAKEFLLLLRQC